MASVSELDRIAVDIFLNLVGLLTYLSTSVELYFPPGTSDHVWPVEVFHSPFLSSHLELRAEYTDIAPTALNMLGVSPPRWRQSSTTCRPRVAPNARGDLRDLGGLDLSRLG